MWFLHLAWSQAWRCLRRTRAWLSQRRAPAPGHRAKSWWPMLRAIVILRRAGKLLLRVCVIAVLVGVLAAAGDRIKAAEPSGQVHVGTTNGAERLECGFGWRLADRASYALWGFWRGSLRRLSHRIVPCQIGPDPQRAGNASPALAHAAWIGKPSPASMLTISESGRPTTLV